MESPTIPPTKKRKLRKGAHSCWECKRRKIRCVFSTPQDTICIGCSQRGIICIDQADKDLIAETLERGSAKESDRRLERIEAMLEDYVKAQQSQNVSEAPSASMGMSQVTTGVSSKDSINAPYRESLGPIQISVSQGLSTTSWETLHSLLPSREKSRRLCASKSFLPCFFQQALTRNYTALSISSYAPLTSARVAELPAQSAHPVLIAQKLLMLACLAQRSPGYRESMEWKARAEQMAAAAIDSVTTKDNLVRNAEGLECLMLEATYYANMGDLRRAFGAVRRAMAIAYLLGIHRPLHQKVDRLDDRAPKFDPSYMWYRIVYADRLFCLILGLPQGSTDITFASSTVAESCEGEEALERAHCVIASRILVRNESESDTLGLTQSIDASIHAACSSLPPSWWLIPAFTRLDSARDRFLATTRLFNQVLHFNLINQTYLPYLLKTKPLGPDAAISEYSKTACATASREILHRYLALQNSDFIVNAYYFVDFFALIAAITLLLLHLERHWQTAEGNQPGVLSHIRSSDRAMVEEAAVLMSKPPVGKAPRILEQLLTVEEEAFGSRSVASGQIMKDDANDRPYFELKIPYYGELRVNSVRICFTRALDIEDLSSGIETLPPSEDNAVDEVKGSDEASFQDWITMDLHNGFDEGAYGGLENAFFDSFQGFLNTSPR